MSSERASFAGRRISLQSQTEELAPNRKKSCKCRETMIWRTTPLTSENSAFKFWDFTDCRTSNSSKNRISFAAFTCRSATCTSSRSALGGRVVAERPGQQSQRWCRLYCTVGYSDSKNPSTSQHTGEPSAGIFIVFLQSLCGHRKFCILPSASHVSRNITLSLSWAHMT